MNVRTMVVLSGKGGAGKTTLAAGLLPFLPRPVLADADVDASNLPLLVDASRERGQPFVGGQLASVRADRCRGCLECVDACRFGAITVPSAEDASPSVDPLACEGCAVCRMVCPADAIEMQAAVSGHWFVSATRFGPMVHARLEPGGERSGALVAQVRREALRIAEAKDRSLILVDGPPGTGCPAISALTGADLALLVTEPTPSGESDLFRVLDLAGHFRIDAVVAVNKADLDPQRARALEEKLAATGVPVVARLPYDDAASRSLCEGHLLSEASTDWHARFGRLWQELASRLDGSARPARTSSRAGEFEPLGGEPQLRTQGGY